MAFDLDKLKQQFYNRVNTLLSQDVYKINAPNNAEYPFAVINFLASSNDVMFKDTYFIDIDLWDDTSDTTILNAMAKTLKTGLHGYWSDNDNLAYRTYVDSPGHDVPTGKVDLARVNARYMAYVF